MYLPFIFLMHLYWFYYLIDIYSMFLHIRLVVHFSSLTEFHGQHPLRGKVPMNPGNFQEAEVFEKSLNPLTVSSLVEKVKL